MNGRPSAAVVAALVILAACGSDAPLEPPPDDTMPPPDPVAASVSIAPDTVRFGALGSTAALSATVKDADGNPLTTAPVTWSHRVTGVSLVSGSGVVTALGNGSDTIVAMAGNVSGTAIVQVAQVAAGVVVTPGQASLDFLGATVNLDATVVDSNGNALPAIPVSWTSSDPVALPVDSTGLVIAARIGSATIAAASGTAADSAAVAVSITGPVGGAITGASVACAGGMAGPFTCSGIDLLAYLPIGAIGGAAGIDLNDLWGWTDPQTGKEYALVMRRDGTAFVDVSDPINPVYLGFLPVTTGAQPNFWHDIKVYADHAFVVADGAGPHGMQVFDLRQLRNVGGTPVTFAPTTVYTGIGSAHNIAINEQTGFAYVMGANGGGTTCGGGLHMIDISAPGNPSFAGCFADPLTGNARTGYTHDAQCLIYQGPDVTHQGREICIGTNETHLSIADVTDKGNPVAISRATYPNVTYAHQGWITDDHRYFFTNDELDELAGATAQSRTLIWDISDLDDPMLVAQYLGPNSAIDHNHYVVGNRLYASNYQFGIRILDITDPENPAPAGFFDTAPTATNSPGFGGSWGNYPFFASGIVVVTSGNEGLFVLRAQ